MHEDVFKGQQTAGDCFPGEDCMAHSQHSLVACQSWCRDEA